MNLYFNLTIVNFLKMLETNNTKKIKIRKKSYYISFLTKILSVEVNPPVSYTTLISIINICIIYYFNFYNKYMILRRSNL